MTDVTFKNMTPDQYKQTITQTQLGFSQYLQDSNNGAENQNAAKYSLAPFQYGSLAPIQKGTPSGTIVYDSNGSSLNIGGRDGVDPYATPGVLSYFVGGGWAFGVHVSVSFLPSCLARTYSRAVLQTLRFLRSRRGASLGHHRIMTYFRRYSFLLCSNPAMAMTAEDMAQPVIFSIGHSTHAYGRFLELVRQAGVTAIADVRSAPFSRRAPQFNQDALRQALQSAVGDRLSESTLEKVCRNAASTWAQSGHLEGRTFKKRHLVLPSTAAATYAIYLAHAAGFRGAEIFSSGWLKVLDCDPAKARELALDAKRSSLLDLRMAGEVIELNLSRLDPLSAKA